MNRYLIIGGGIAGTTVAGEIRKRDQSAEIVIIEQGHEQLYSKVLLGPFCEGKIPREKLFLKKEEWYQEQNIELILGTSAQNLDTKNQFVLLSNGREMPYDKLLITTGVEPKLFEADLRGVTYLRSLDDAEHLIELIARAKANLNQQVCVLGGSFVSVDFINIFAAHQLPTSVILHSSGFWSKSLSTRSQQIIANHLERQGVKILTQQRDIKLVGDQELEAVKLEDGTKLPAAILAIGIGVARDLNWLINSSVKVCEGILVNEFLETNVENIYAAGDVAQFCDLTIGRQVLSGTWNQAILQARTVAATMTGERQEFKVITSRSCEILGLKTVFLGDPERSQADKVVELSKSDDQATELFVRQDRIVGAALIGDMSQRQKITDAIAQGRSINFLI